MRRVGRTGRASGRPCEGRQRGGGPAACVYRTRAATRASPVANTGNRACSGIAEGRRGAATAAACQRPARQGGSRGLGQVRSECGRVHISPPGERGAAATPPPPAALAAVRGPCRVLSGDGRVTGIPWKEALQVMGRAS